MINRVHYFHCPVCNSTDINPLLTVKDYTVSKEEFVIWQCGQCSLRFTQDVPDADTIGPYYQSEEYISHTNTSKGLVNQLYQRVRKLTLEQKAKLIKDTTGQTHGKLLDVGCGIGAFVHTMQQKGWQATGLEPDATTRKLSKELYGLELKEASELFNLPPASFDAITLWHVLEHVHDLQSYIGQLKTLLKSTGLLFIAVPNYQSVDASIYGSSWAAYDVPRHLYHFTPKAIQVLMKQHGLQVVDEKPMWFDSFYISMLSSKYRHGKTSLFGSFISGLRSNVTALANKERCSSLIYVIKKV
jgi:2-polyprenyl-3-methyl-5-hydroxy-6-metoxy-1,4-benzoquinol methylase/ribosomal protein L37AE/L43A